MTIASVNPATGQVIEELPGLTPAELDARLTAAADAFLSYRTTSFASRAEWLRRLADLFDQEADRLAEIVTSEMGKTLAAARSEAHKCARGCRYFAEHGEELLAGESVDPATVDARRAYTRYEPLGAVLAIMPWNFPLWQVIRFAAPAVMAGNVGLLKHAPNVPRTALALEELFRRAGFPAGVFQTLLIEVEAVADLIADDRVVAVTLTGSGRAGRAVAEQAGRALKPCVLELGGSDPFIVTASADVARAAEVAVTARCQNNGQSCIAAKRFIVDRAVAADFRARLVEGMRALRVGDPTDPATDLGPLVSERARQDLEAQVDDAVRLGAKVLLGGERLAGPGFFYPPTVLEGVTPAMRLYREEAFGPVAVLYEVDSLEAALEVANDTRYGLGANVWTEDPAEADRAIAGLEAGAVFVNGMTTSYPELPFGGVKESGFGRELAAPGMRAFCNLKTVWVAPGHDRLAR